MKDSLINEEENLKESTFAGTLICGNFVPSQGHLGNLTRPETKLIRIKIDDFIEENLELGHCHPLRDQS